ILSDQDILDAVWPDSTYAASPDVKQHVYLLRQKLAVAHADPKSVIVNEKGFGYRLEPPTNESELSVD
ncbi:helix-turn-helix domain-containing protein, partial [Candidatus Bipolaricaulota bacterium]|nr:helix-turn-helix domain-containing protein [Candidatus Bipolaricaulota bacterium]